MLQLLSAQLRRHEHSAQGVAVERSFAQYAAFAFVWAFGGELRPAARERFEAAVMSYVKQLSPDFPTTDGTTMFDKMRRFRFSEMASSYTPHAGTELREIGRDGSFTLRRGTGAFAAEVSGVQRVASRRFGSAFKRTSSAIAKISRRADGDQATRRPSPRSMNLNKL